jgi:hypothetical protein
MSHQNRPVTDLERHRFQGGVAGGPIDALTILEAEYRAVVRTHDSLFAHQQEFAWARVQR